MIDTRDLLVELRDRYLNGSETEQAEIYEMCYSVVQLAAARATLEMSKLEYNRKLINLEHK